MPLQSPILPSHYDNAVITFFRRIKSALFTLWSKQWKDESLYNTSCAQHRITDHYAALYLVHLIYRDIQEGLVTTWAEIVIKYDLVALDKCLACKDINLTSIFEDFGYPFVDCSCGIECMGFHVSFQIEPDCNPCVGCGDNPTTTAVYNLKEIITNLNECTNTLVTT